MATSKNKLVVKEVKAIPCEAIPPAAQGKLEITSKPEDLYGSYSNFAVIRHTKREFVVDFVWRLDNTNLLVSRIISSPQHAKAIHKALGTNIENYEKNFGAIPEE